MSATRWHWVMTVQTPHGIVGSTDVVTLPAGASRHDVFRELYEQQARQHGGQIAVLFFDLQPDRL